MMIFKGRSVGILAAALFALALMPACNKDIEGCMDPTADNFDPDATIDDGSCEYTNASLIEDDITTSTTLENRITNPDAADYTICADVDVEADLTIMPGVRIEFCSGNSLDVTANGSINAIGTAAEPIVFTGQTETPGFWEVVHINSNNPDNQFEHVVFSYGGGDDYYDYAMVWVNDNNNGQASFKNVTFDNSKEIGLLAEADAAISGFENNIFSNNGTYGLSVSSSHLGSLDAASNYNSGNTEPYIYVASTAVNQNATWNAASTAYLMHGSTDIRADVKIMPGSQFAMASGAEIDVNQDGSLNAVGTASEMITFKGEASSPGYWDVIHFNSNNPLNELRYVELTDGGGVDYYNYATIWVNDNNNGTLTIYNSSVSNSYGWGMYVEQSATIDPGTEADMLSNNTFSNNRTGTNSNCTAPCDVIFK